MNRKGRQPTQHSATTPQKGEVYLEYQVVGTSQKVSAIDSRTGLEVSVTGPANAPRQQITRIAVQKLQRKLSQQ